MPQVKVVYAKRKTLSLCVTRDGQAIVRAPYGVSGEKIASFVQKHELWLKKRLNAAALMPELRLSDGAKLILFGSEYTIETGAPKIEDRTFYLPPPPRENAFERLLRRFSKETLSIIVEKIALRYGFDYTNLTVTAARGRWGSCNQKRRLCFSFRLAFLPPDCIEYVCVHELCHTLHLNHGTEFWAEVERILPDYNIRRNKLKSYAYVMNWL